MSTDERSEWRGLFTPRREPPDVIEVAAILGQSPGGGGSQPFQVQTTDGKRWWMKARNNPQSGKVIVTEQIVGRLGRLIDAPVCEVAIIDVPDALAGFQYAPGRFLEPGPAHGSGAVPDVVEVRGAPAYRSDDDNAARHVGAFAIHDWCWAGDTQWLHRETAERMLFSHDHGYYLPPDGAGWDEASLESSVDEPRPAPWPAEGLSPQAIAATAARLRALTRDDIVTALRAIPASWPVSDNELEAAGWFLERRATPVADRLLALAGGSA